MSSKSRNQLTSLDIQDLNFRNTASNAYQRVSTVALRPLDTIQRGVLIVIFEPTNDFDGFTLFKDTATYDGISIPYDGKDRTNASRCIGIKFDVIPRSCDFRILTTQPH